MSALPMLPTLTMDGQSEDWTCTCGNQPHTDGFYPCDPTGRELDPTLDPWDGVLMVCGWCQTIIRMV